MYVLKYPHVAITASRYCRAVVWRRFCFSRMKKYTDLRWAEKKLMYAIKCPYVAITALRYCCSRVWRRFCFSRMKKYTDLRRNREKAYVCPQISACCHYCLAILPCSRLTTLLLFAHEEIC
ncbi:hypothetical protein SAMN05421659_101104 [[Clostridium] fimetarium]|uniref:Uncharacterized protein n=1 Tax=[Clostridium] fimetarium TaxID=99656 RepID=A0A1I0M1X0_9FIRM|nr:hypothetical protein SAMN05421659_101104 [[Clostridium] fimetarium]